MVSSGPAPCPDRTSGHAQSGHASTAVERLLSLARLHLGMEVAFVSRFTTEQQVILAAEGETEAMNVTAGQGSDLNGSFCTRVLAGTLPAVIPDARRHPVTADLKVTRDLNIGSYIGAPWRDDQGTVAGMLCCLSRHAQLDLQEQDTRYLGLLADLIGDHLKSPAAAQRRLNAQLRTEVGTQPPTTCAHWTSPWTPPPATTPRTIPARNPAMTRARCATTGRKDAARSAITARVPLPETALTDRGATRARDCRIAPLMCISWPTRTVRYRSPKPSPNAR